MPGATPCTRCQSLSGNKQPPDIKVVQLKGGVTRTSKEFPTGELAVTFARAFNGTAYLLPAPTFVEDEAAREVLVREPSIQNILRLGRRANIALVSIGYPSRNSVLVKAGFFTAGDIENMRANGAVGISVPAFSAGMAAFTVPTWTGGPSASAWRK